MNHRDLARDLARERDLDLALARDLDLHRDLAQDLDHARDLIIRLDLARDLAGKLDHDFHRDLARDLAHARALIRALARDLDRARARDRPRDSRCGLRATAEQDIAADDTSSTPGRVPQGLVALAVRVLPVPARPRYQEEFGVELMDVPRPKRLGHALRVLASAWQLRQALLEEVRTSDGDAPRLAEQ